MSNCKNTEDKSEEFQHAHFPHATIVEHRLSPIRKSIPKYIIVSENRKNCRSSKTILIVLFRVRNLKGDLHSALRMTHHLSLRGSLKEVTCSVYKRFSEQDGGKLGDSTGISRRRSSISSEKVLFRVQVIKKKREKFTILKEVSLHLFRTCVKRTWDHL